MENVANVAHKTNECLYYITIMHILNVILKRINASSTDVLNTHEETYETEHDELVSKASKSHMFIYQSQGMV